MKLHCIFSPSPVIKWHLVLILSTESVASLLLSPLNILHPHWPVGQWLHGTSMVEWVFLMKPCYVHCCVHSRFAWYPLIWRSGAADYGSPWQNWTTCWERMLWPLISLAIEYICCSFSTIESSCNGPGGLQDLGSHSFLSRSAAPNKLRDLTPSARSCPRVWPLIMRNVIKSRKHGFGMPLGSRCSANGVHIIAWIQCIAWFPKYPKHFLQGLP